jgi:hypothetical protein
MNPQSPDLTWHVCGLLVCIALIAGMSLNLAWPAIRSAMRKRNHRVSAPLGRPHQSCRRNYVP